MEHTARLEVWVRRHRLSRSVFAGKGIEGVLEIFGIAIDRGENMGNSLFDCKETYITITSEGLPTDFGENAKSPKAFGWLRTLKDVRPLPCDYETGELSDRPPIETHVEIDNDAFAAIAAQLASAETRHIAASLTIRFGGPNVPAPTDSRQEQWGVRWEEYARDEVSEDYSDLADAGTFDARVPVAPPTPADCDLYLYLRYTQHDARDFLLPFLVNRPQGLAVEMDAILLADAKMLHAEPNGMTARVAKYALRLSRPGA